MPREQRMILSFNYMSRRREHTNTLGLTLLMGTNFIRLELVDLAGINFSDFDILIFYLFENVAINLISASTIFSEKWAIH